LKELLLANDLSTNVELILADVDDVDIKNLLNVLYCGSCSCNVEQVSSLYKLMNSLGFHSLAGSISSTRIETIIVNDDSGLKTSSLSKAKSKSDCFDSLFVEKVDDEIITSSCKDGIGQGPYFCLVCGKGEHTPYALRAHYTSCHFFDEVAALITNKESSQCELCDQRFSMCHNWFGNLVRHRGTTHQDVNQFIQRHCSENKGEGSSCCAICGVSVLNLSCNNLAEHLIEAHYKSELLAMCNPVSSKCTICEYESESIEDMVLHIGIDHGCVMRLYKRWRKNMFKDDIEYPLQKSRSTPRDDDYLVKSNRQRLTSYKKCHICETKIQIRGSTWKYPLYTHIARKHFKEELLRDFRTREMKCSECGIEEKDCPGEFVLHLGAKHKLVETYFDDEVYKHYEKKYNPARMEESKVSDESSNWKHRSMVLIDSDLNETPDSTLSDYEMNICNQSHFDNYNDGEGTMMNGNVIEGRAVQTVKPKQKHSSHSETNYKKCHVCDMQIASCGVYWFYSHIARKHYKHELLRDFRTQDSRCSICGIEEKEFNGGESNFVLHLGAKHRLVETYMDRELVKKYRGSVIKSPRKETRQSFISPLETYDIPDEDIEQLQPEDLTVDTENNKELQSPEGGKEETSDGISIMTTIGLD